MSDIDPTWGLIGLGFITSFFATLFSGGIGKIIAVVAGLPTLIFIISILYAVVQYSLVPMHNPQELNPVITGIVNGLIPILITAIGEAFGTPCGKILRKLLKWD